MEISHKLTNISSRYKSARIKKIINYSKRECRNLRTNFINFHHCKISNIIVYVYFSKISYIFTDIYSLKPTGSLVWFARCFFPCRLILRNGSVSPRITWLQLLYLAVIVALGSTSIGGSCCIVLFVYIALGVCTFVVPRGIFCSVEVAATYDLWWLPSVVMVHHVCYSFKSDFCCPGPE